jgi:hypothetical protein
MLTDQAASLKGIHSDLAHIGELMQHLVKVASAMAEQQKSNNTDPGFGHRRLIHELYRLRATSVPFGTS